MDTDSWTGISLSDLESDRTVWLGPNTFFANRCIRGQKPFSRIDPAYLQKSRLFFVRHWPRRVLSGEVNDLTDQQLLRDYAKRRSEAAFTELVRRHIDLVHSAAFRLTGNAQAAKDVSQAVFTVLAQNADRLTRHPVVSGWLHTTARNLASKTIRADVRRQHREQEAATMNELLSAAPDASWEEIAPHLDAALGELSESDRDAVMLRYFEKKTAPEMAAVLGISDEAAQKRVRRAVERLRDFFARRGIAVGTGGLVAVVSANAVQAAPAGLGLTISAAALAGTAATTAAATTTIATATKTIAMTTLQKALVTTTIAVLAGAGIYEARQATQLRGQVQTLQQQQAPLTNDIARLQAETARLSNLVAKANDQERLTEEQFRELLRLRGRTGQLRNAMQALEEAQATIQRQNTTMSATFTNAAALGIKAAMKHHKRAVAAKVARMTEMLHLSEDQAWAISDVLQARIEEESRFTLQALTGGNDLAPVLANRPSEDDEVLALLTPEQAGAYEDFKQAERVADARKSADAEASTMTEELGLTPGQQEQIRDLLLQDSLNPSVSDSAANAEAVLQACSNGDYTVIVDYQIQTLHQNMENKLHLLEDVLTAEQLRDYEQSQVEQIEVQAGALRMLLPQTNGAPAQ